MIDQTFYDGFTLTKAYRALGNGKEQTAEAVEFVSRLLSAGLLIRERTPDSAVPNEPGPAGPYPMSASLPEQRRAFALQLPGIQNVGAARPIERYLAGPTGDAQSSDPVTSGEANIPEAKNPYSITENPYAHQAWEQGYKAANRPLKKLSDIDRDPAVAVAPFLPPTEYEASYDRGYEQGRKFADAAIYVNGWNAALGEVLAKVSLAVRRTEVQTLSGVLTVHEILSEMKK